MVEEKMARLDIEETRSGEVDVRPADEDDRRGDADQRGNARELERGLWSLGIIALIALEQNEARLAHRHGVGRKGLFAKDFRRVEALAAPRSCHGSA